MLHTVLFPLILKITNNIFYNSTEFYTQSSNINGQIEIRPTPTPNGIQPYNNTILRNVYFYYNKSSYLINAGGEPAGTWNISWIPEIDYNLYYNPNIKIGNFSLSQFTPAGSTWNDWIMAYNKRYDQNSLVDTDPMFKDVNNGNFEIDPSSTLITELKFEPISSYIADC